MKRSIGTSENFIHNLYTINTQNLVLNANCFVYPQNVHYLQIL